MFLCSRIRAAMKESAETTAVRSRLKNSALYHFADHHFANNVKIE